MRLIVELMELLESSRRRILKRMDGFGGMMAASHTFQLQENLHKPMADHFNGKVRLEMTQEQFQAHVDNFMRFNTITLNNEYEDFGGPNRLEARHRAFFQQLWEAYQSYDFTEAQQLEMSGKHDPLTCELCQGHLPQLCKARKA